MVHWWNIWRAMQSPTLSLHKCCHVLTLKSYSNVGSISFIRIRSLPLIRIPVFHSSTFVMSVCSTFDYGALAHAYRQRLYVLQVMRRQLVCTLKSFRCPHFFQTRSSFKRLWYRGTFSEFGNGLTIWSTAWKVNTCVSYYILVCVVYEPPSWVSQFGSSPWLWLHKSQ